MKRIGHTGKATKDREAIQTALIGKKIRAVDSKTLNVLTIIVEDENGKFQRYSLEAVHAIGGIYGIEVSQEGSDAACLTM